MKDLYMIACVSRDNGLGKDGHLLWQIPEDMRFFRATTQDSMVIMGRKTFESIGRALPGRRNVVLSSRRGDAAAGSTTGAQTDADTNHADDVEWCTREELDEILRTTPGKKFIIGGASLYSMFLPEVERIYLTEVASTQPADTWFPEFNREDWTRKVLQTGEHDGIKYEMVEYSKGGKV